MTSFLQPHEPPDAIPLEGNAPPQKLYDRPALVLKINRLLLSRLEPATLFQTISTLLWDYTRHDFASIFTFVPSEAAAQLQFMHVATCQERRGSGDDGPLPLVMAWPDNGSGIELLEAEQIRLLKPENLSHFLWAKGIRSLCRAPLVSMGRRLGVLCLGSQAGEHFTLDTLGLLEQITPQLALAMDNAMARREILSLREQLAEEVLVPGEGEARQDFAPLGLIGSSRALGQVLRQIGTVAPTDSTVLLLGETGTGKELVARAIHECSRRQAQAFVKTNCSAIPTGLMESELFGHERGAFTGAIQRKAGRFELANGGSLFLDEIGDLPAEVQPKLLRAIQEREFERLGSNQTIRVDVRLIAATHRDLAGMVQERTFRSDLFYRLNVFPIQIPPLRERREDIPVLVRHFVSKYASAMDRRIERIPSMVMDRLSAQPWPGNIRQLQNLIERSVILSHGPELRIPQSELDQAPGADFTSSPRPLEDVEREHILRTLKDCGGLVSGPKGAAARLGMKRTTLNYRMKKLGIDRRDI